MKLNKAETIIELDKFLEVNKATANYYWKKSKQIATPYYNRIKKYEEIRNTQR